MSQICDYCDEEYDVDGCLKIVSHGVGPHNVTTWTFCSVVCRTWWRRRESDEPGEWEQPAPEGYQGRLDRFVSDDNRSESVAGTVSAKPTTESESAQEATA